LYWFTIEFGLIQEDEQIKIYGAGIISSKKEIVHSMSLDSEKLNFNIDDIFNSDFDTQNLQDKYFVITSFSQLYDSLTEIEANLVQRLNSSYEGNASLVNIVKSELYPRNWKIINEFLCIELSIPNNQSFFEFKSKVNLLSEQLNHHLELVKNDNNLIILLTTHDCDSISFRDIEFARKINKLLTEEKEIITRAPEFHVM
jgi:pterin-4a-carbinolamine dehydratase